MATYAGPPPTHSSKEKTSEGYDKISSINTKNNYDSGLDLVGKNKKLQEDFFLQEPNRTIEIDFSDEKNQENQHFTEEEYDLLLKGKGMKEKMALVTMKMEKNQKYDEVSQCMKEGMHRVLKLIEIWADVSSIAGVIDANGILRRDDYGEIKKWIYQPRVIVRHK